MPHEPNLWQSASQSNFTPTTGQTLAATDDSTDQLIMLNHAASIAALTLNLPSEANSRIGQHVGLSSLKPVVVFTLGQIGGGATILGAPVALNASDIYYLTKIGANTWTVK